MLTLIRFSLAHHLPNLLIFTTLALLAWAIFYWASIFLDSPQHHAHASESAPISGKVLAEQAVASRLFGGEFQNNVSVESAPIASLSNIVVRGIYAGSNGRSGFAVLIVDEKVVSAVLGEEFLPGLVLQRVYQDSVEILRNGKIEIARMVSAPISITETPTPSIAKAAPSGLQINVRQSSPGQFAFSSEEMMAALKNPDQKALLGNFIPHPQGGAMLEYSPPDGLPGKLDLIVGDVITRINGKRLSRPGDVNRFYEQIVRSESVNIEVLRGGARINIGIEVDKD
jgi:type II secretory pathway component PulC